MPSFGKIFGQNKKRLKFRKFRHTICSSHAAEFGTSSKTSEEVGVGTPPNCFSVTVLHPTKVSPTILSKFKRWRNAPWKSQSNWHIFKFENLIVENNWVCKKSNVTKLKCNKSWGGSPVMEDPLLVVIWRRKAQDSLDLDTQFCISFWCDWICF